MIKTIKYIIFSILLFTLFNTNVFANNNASSYHVLTNDITINSRSGIIDGLLIAANDTSTCEGFLGDKTSPEAPAYYLHFALIAMRYIAIILALVLSTVDFFKAIYSQDKDLLKKASLTATKRLIFAVVIFFIPIIIEYILSLLGAYTVKCV